MDKNTAILRQNIINLIRDFFICRNFLEVETPLLVARPDPCPYNEVFETSWNNSKAYFTPSPELMMKKLLCQNYGNIFQICKAFRNNYEGNSSLHNPEFTILEWYRINSDYRDIMTDCEKLVNYIYQGLNLKKSNLIKYQNFNINITPPWIKLSVKEAFQKYAKINLDEFLDLQTARKIAIKKGYSVEKNTSWEEMFNQIFLNEVEPKIYSLSKPVFLYDYPGLLSSLAKRAKDNRYVERFELYIAGLEIGNCFSELSDWKEQEKRFKEEIRQRKKKKMKVFDIDSDFINHLKKRLGKIGGIAVGIDRLIMLFADKKAVEEVLFFPAKRLFSKK